MTITETPTTNDTANGQVIEAELVQTAEAAAEEATNTGLAIREVLSGVLERQLDAGHSPQVEKPAEFQAALAAHLTGT